MSLLLFLSMIWSNCTFLLPYYLIYKPLSESDITVWSSAKRSVAVLGELVSHYKSVCSSSLLLGSRIKILSPEFTSTSMFVKFTNNTYLWMTICGADIAFIIFYGKTLSFRILNRFFLCYLVKCVKKVNKYHTCLYIKLTVVLLFALN